MPTRGRPEAPGGMPACRALGDQLAEAAHDVVDLAADAAEDPHATVGQGRAQLGFLTREGDELRRTLERDERPGLPAILAEEIAVVVVVEDDDGDEALLAHALLDASDALVLDVHRDRPAFESMCHRSVDPFVACIKPEPGLRSGGEVMVACIGRGRAAGRVIDLGSTRRCWMSPKSSAGARSAGHEPSEPFGIRAIGATGHRGRPTSFHRTIVSSAQGTSVS